MLDTPAFASAAVAAPHRLASEAGRAILNTITHGTYQDVRRIPMSKLPKNRFHLVFSLVMGAMMISLMTLVITFINVGLVADFVARWLRALRLALLRGLAQQR